MTWLWILLAFFAGDLFGFLMAGLMAAHDSDMEPTVREVDIDTLERWLTDAKRRAGLSW